LFEYHPLFQVKARGLEIWPAGRDLNPARGEKPKTIEGGDVLVLNDHIVVIGQSERSTESAIQSIVEALFCHPASQRVDTVYQVNLPRDRTFMHLDTVMTLVDENLILVYEDAIQKLRPKGSRVKPTVRYKRQADGTYTTESLRNTIIEELVELSSTVESLKGLQIIRVAAREQRSDAANVFVLGPRKVASYSRNTDTNHRLKERGVEVHKFNGPELLRGLGGPRCMTMPLVRSAFYYVESRD
jgi:arginine deiminase